MKENDIDIVELIINNMPEENELQYRIKLYMQAHKQNCNDFIYAKYSKETTFINATLKSLSADLGFNIVEKFKEKNMI